MWALILMTWGVPGFPPHPTGLLLFATKPACEVQLQKFMKWEPNLVSYPGRDGKTQYVKAQVEGYCTSAFMEPAEFHQLLHPVDDPNPPKLSVEMGKPAPLPQGSIPSDVIRRGNPTVINEEAFTSKSGISTSSTFVFSNDADGRIAQIESDGTVKVFKTGKNKEAAQAFWDAVRQFTPACKPVKSP